MEQWIASPNWWGTIAPPVATFLSDNNFSGKTIIPFITHEGSGFGRSIDDMKELCPDAVFLTGLPIRGESVGSANGDILKWLRDINIIKAVVVCGTLTLGVLLF